MASTLLFSKDQLMVDILKELEEHIAAMLGGKEGTDEIIVELKAKSDRAAGGSIKPLVEERIKRGMSNAQILKEVLELHHEAKTSKASVAWYRSQMTKKLYKPLVKALRKSGVTQDLEDKEIVAVLQKNNLDKEETAAEFFKNYKFDEEVQVTEGEEETAEQVEQDETVGEETDQHAE